MILNYSNYGRIQEWKRFRNECYELFLDEKLEKIPKYFLNMPIAPSISIDPWDSNTWPSPWEIVLEGDFCKYSVWVMIAYTFAFLGHEVELVLIEDNDYKLICIIEGKVIGLDIDSIFNVEDIKLKVHQKFRFEGDRFINVYNYIRRCGRIRKDYNSKGSIRSLEEKGI